MTGKTVPALLAAVLLLSAAPPVSAARRRPLRNPCSAHVPMPPLAPEGDGLRPFVEAMLQRACWALDRCGVQASFADLSGKSLAELGLWDEPLRTLLRDSIAHAVEGHDAAHKPMRRIPFAMDAAQTLGQLADSVEAGVRLRRG